ncbi:hypothetical protein ACHAP4_008507 [Fusarium culmorum]
MSLPTLLKVEGFLRPFMVTNPEDRLRFGHITIPPYRFGKAGLIDSVRRIHDVPHYKMLFIVSPDVEELKDDDSFVSSVTRSFSQLFLALRANRSDNGWVSRENQDPESRMQYLPRSITLIMWLDPEMSADCALALIGIVKWATQVFQYDGADVSVLTMAVGNDDILSNVVSLISPSSIVAHFDLNAEAEQDTLAGSVIHEGHRLASVAGHILKSFRKAPNHKRLVISFDAGLRQQLESQFQNEELQSFEFLSINANAPSPALQKFKRPVKGCLTRVVIFTCAASLLPFEFKELDEVHLVLGCKILRDKVWDDASAQVTTKSRPTSEEERRLQLWWARQPSTKGRFVYVPAATAHIFAKSGPRDHLVENAHIGGFVASVIDLVAWGINHEIVARIFIRYELRLLEMRERLAYQCIINLQNDGLALSGTEAIIFRAMLTYFEYDHRLALMVALDCDPMVRVVKVYIAVLLMHGVTDLVEIQKNQSGDPKIRRTVMEMCHRLSPSLRNKGVLWLVLGLLGPGVETTVPGAVTDVISFQRYNLGKRSDLVDHILFRLHQLDIELDIELDINVSWEFEKLSADAEIQLQSHLLHSFIYQLTMVHYNKVDGKRGPEHGHNFKLLTTFTDCGMAVPKGQSLTTLFNSAFLIKKGDDVAYAIAHELGTTMDGTIFGRFWTSISRELVKEWMSVCDEQRPQCSRCLDKDIPCEYPRSPKSRTLRSPVSDTEETWSQHQILAVPTPDFCRSTGTSIGSVSSIPSPFLAPSPNYELGANLFTHETIAPSVDLGATELELFSYYLSHAARSMAYDDEDLYALQVGFPNLAFRSKPLMSSILALAAVRKCYDILFQSVTQNIDRRQVKTLLALADEHHRDSLRQTQADIPNANHYDHVVANAPLMVLYATANHAVRIKLSNTLDDQDGSTDLAPAQLHWMTLIRAAHLAYTGLLHSNKDFNLLDDFTTSPPAITLNQPISGLVPMAENGPTQRTETLLMPIIAATYSSALEKLQTRAQTLQFSMHLASSGRSRENCELQACLVALQSLASILSELFEAGNHSHDTSQLDLENDWAALSQLSDVSPWLRTYMARVTFSTPPKPLRRTIMWFLNRVPAEFLSIIQSTVDNIPGTVPDEGIQCDTHDASEVSRLSMDIFAHWLVLVMLLDGVWWIGGIGVCELGRISKYLGRQQEGSTRSESTWWPRSMLNIAIEIGKQD